jgi:hypothetical protein
VADCPAPVPCAAEVRPRALSPVRFGSAELPRAAHRRLRVIAASVRCAVAAHWQVPSQVRSGSAERRRAARQRLRVIAASVRYAVAAHWQVPSQVRFGSAEQRQVGRPAVLRASLSAWKVRRLARPARRWAEQAASAQPGTALPPAVAVAADAAGVPWRAVLVAGEEPPQVVAAGVAGAAAAAGLQASAARQREARASPVPARFSAAAAWAFPPLPLPAR